MGDEASCRRWRLARCSGCRSGSFGATGGRYEEEGLAGLVDRRLGKASFRRVPIDKVVWMLGEYRTHHMGWNVKHFHEHLRAQHGFRWGYTWTKTQLHTARSGGAGGAAWGAPSQAAERKPCEGMMLHQDGSRAAWLDGQADARPDRHAGRCDQHYLLGVSGRGGRHRLDLAGATGGVRCARPAGRASIPTAAATTSSRLRRARRWTRSRLTPGRTRARPARHRAYSGLLAGGARALRAHVRHAAGSAAEGAQARRDPRHRSRQSLHSRSLSAGRTTRALPDRRRSRKARSWPRDPAMLAEILCIEVERVVARDNTIAHGRHRLQLPPKVRCAPTTSRPASRYASTRTGTLAVFHGPRRIACYSAQGTELVDVPTSSQPDAVLAAVKAWPGNRRACGERAATASLDRGCARRHRRQLRVGTKKRPSGSNKETDQQREWSWPRPPRPDQAHTRRGVHRFRTGSGQSQPEADK